MKNFASSKPNFKRRGEGSLSYERHPTDILGINKYTNYKQALNEAVANALDARASKALVNISVESIDVIDDGIGMNEEVLLTRYFTLGEKNPDPEARSLFGIGVCANAALGSLLTVETRPKGQDFGIRIVADFDKVRQVDVGKYQAEEWSKHVDFRSTDYSTKIRIERLRWKDIDIEDIKRFLIEKHWPLLMDKSIGIKIYVNGKELTAKEPLGVEKFVFDSSKEFRIDAKHVPAQPNLSCGRIEGIIYFKEAGFEEPSIDVYVKNQRIDAYSGDQVDWLRIKDLRSPDGFRSRIKGIIKVQATDEEDFRKRSVLDRDVLRLKSDRSAFFEESSSFRELCAYLNERSNGRILHIPYGGILRLINAEWYKKRGADITKTQEMINKYREDLATDLRKIFEEEPLKNEPGGELEKEVRQQPSATHIAKPQNALFRCPKCDNIIRITIGIYDQWKLASDIEKKAMQQEYWKCDVCGTILDPEKDKYRRGPIKGQRIMTVHLEEGPIAHIVADQLGKSGPRSMYLPEDSTVKINAEHALLVYSLKTSDTAFKCYLLDSIIFAMALQRSKACGETFESIYNQLSARVSRVINPGEFEDALEVLKIRHEEGVK